MVNNRFIELFLEMLASAKSASLNTLEAYKHDLLDLNKFLVSNHAEIDTASIDVLRSYLLYMNSLHYKKKLLRAKFQH